MKTRNLLLLLPLMSLLFCSCPEDTDDKFGKLAYLTNLRGLVIADITDPSAPIEVGVGEMPNGCNDVMVQGDYAYVTDRINKKMVVFDVENEREPKEVGSCIFPDECNFIAVQDYYAFVSVNETLHSVDISNPRNPQLVGSLDLNTDYGHINDFVVEGAYAYVSHQGGLALVIIDIDNPSNMVVKGSVHPGGSFGNFTGICVEGDYAYLCENYNHGLIAFNIADPSNPKVVGYEDVFGDNNAVFSDGNFLYIASIAAAGYDNGGLHILSHSGDSSPYLESSYKTVEFGGYGVVVEGKYAYVAENSGLLILDISNPTGIAEVALLQSGFTYNLDVGIR